ncbi:Oxygen sensor protein DosP [compost metagenome]
MKVIAEGIETTQQVAVLRQFGCLMGQGYLFSRPVPASDATQMLRLFGQKLPLRPRTRANA